MGRMVAGANSQFKAVSAEDAESHTRNCSTADKNNNQKGFTVRSPLPATLRCLTVANVYCTRV